MGLAPYHVRRCWWRRRWTWRRGWWRCSGRRPGPAPRRRWSWDETRSRRTCSCSSTWIPVSRGRSGSETNAEKQRHLFDEIIFKYERNTISPLPSWNAVKATKINPFYSTLAFVKYLPHWTFCIVTMETHVLYWPRRRCSPSSWRRRHL